MATLLWRHGEALSMVCPASCVRMLLLSSMPILGVILKVMHGVWQVGFRTRNYRAACIVHAISLCWSVCTTLAPRSWCHQLKPVASCTFNCSISPLLLWCISLRQRQPIRSDAVDTGFCFAILLMIQARNDPLETLCPAQPCLV